MKNEYCCRGVDLTRQNVPDLRGAIWYMQQQTEELASQVAEKYNLRKPTLKKETKNDTRQDPLR